MSVDINSVLDQASISDFDLIRSRNVLQLPSDDNEVIIHKSVNTVSVDIHEPGVELELGLDELDQMNPRADIADVYETEYKGDLADAEIALNFTDVRERDRLRAAGTEKLSELFGSVTAPRPPRDDHERQQKELKEQDEEESRNDIKELVRLMLLDLNTRASQSAPATPATPISNATAGVSASLTPIPYGGTQPPYATPARQNPPVVFTRTTPTPIPADHSGLETVANRYEYDLNKLREGFNGGKNGYSIVKLKRTLATAIKDRELVYEGSYKSLSKLDLTHLVHGFLVVRSNQDQVHLQLQSPSSSIQVPVTASSSTEPILNSVNSSSGQGLIMPTTFFPRTLIGKGNRYKPEEFVSFGEWWVNTKLLYEKNPVLAVSRINAGTKQRVKVNKFKNRFITKDFQEVITSLLKSKGKMPDLSDVTADEREYFYQIVAGSKYHLVEATDKHKNTIEAQRVRLRTERSDYQRMNKIKVLRDRFNLLVGQIHAGNNANPDIKKELGKILASFYNYRIFTKEDIERFRKEYMEL